MDKWINFYEPFFPSRSDVESFVSALENLGPDDPTHKAKIMMHQVQRLVSLADDVLTIRPGKQSLQLLFLITCTEHITKLFDHFEEDGYSKRYVRQFFERFLSAAEKEQLRLGFTKFGMKLFETSQDVVDMLYGVRCDVVHEGQYWGFHFSDNGTAMLNSNPDVIANISLADFRGIIVKGCIRAIENYQPAI